VWPITSTRRSGTSLMISRMSGKRRCQGLFEVWVSTIASGAEAEGFPLPFKGTRGGFLVTGSRQGWRVATVISRISRLVLSRVGIADPVIGVAVLGASPGSEPMISGPLPSRSRPSGPASELRLSQAGLEDPITNSISPWLRAWASPGRLIKLNEVRLAGVDGRTKILLQLIDVVCSMVSRACLLRSASRASSSNLACWHRTHKGAGEAHRGATTLRFQLVSARSSASGEHLAAFGH